MNTEPPLLLCDIDGVLSLWGFDPANPPPGQWAQLDGTAHYLSTAGAAHLRALTADRYELVWCSGWEERADEHLPGLLDLPAGQPHLTFEGRSHAEVSAHGHWKLPAIEAYIGDRAVAWIDDAHDDACVSWAEERQAPTALVRTDPATGLDDRAAAELTEFADGIIRQ